MEEMQIQENEIIQIKDSVNRRWVPIQEFTSLTCTQWVRMCDNK